MNTTDKKYALLKYKSINLGDEIQSLAARQFLPKIDYYIDRDELSQFQLQTPDKVKVICNGWFSHQPENWPPQDNIEPLLISMHLSPNAETRLFTPNDLGLAADPYFIGSPMKQYLNKYGPVGARDLYTFERLKRAGVDCYFSGCITLTLAPRHIPKQKDVIILNDVPLEVYEHVRKKTSKIVVSTTHQSSTVDNMTRFREAERLLELYESASCVITTRLHAALPCLGLGTPVMLLTTARDQERFSGLLRLLNHGSVSSFCQTNAFDFENPVENSSAYYALAAESRRRIVEYTTSDFTQDRSVGLIRHEIIIEALKSELEARTRELRNSRAEKHPAPAIPVPEPSLIDDKWWRRTRPLRKLSNRIRKLRGKQPKVWPDLDGNDPGKQNS